MEEKLPYIHVFRDMDKFYFYDTNKNKIVCVSEKIYDILQGKNFKKGFEKYPVLNKLKQEGFLSSNRVEEIVHPANDIIEDILENKLMRICLQITQQCNFRCTYCVYSGEYENRVHTSNKMNWNTAKKGIDFLISHSKDTSKINIGFYGGEPLLNFELIHKCMEYATKSAEGKKVTFSMTTNASLLNDEMLSFFLKYDMIISVSIDGPREIHNNHRKFAANGSGTFDTVYNNLKGLIKEYPEFKKKLQFSMVVDPTIQVNCLNEFLISEEELFGETGISGTFISEVNRKEAVKSNSEFIRDWQYDRFMYLLYLLGKVSYSNNLKLLASSFVHTLDFISNSNKNYATLGPKNHHGGPCVPGQLRLFMNVEGDFFPCERVNEKSYVMKIGNIDQGFYFDKIKKLLNIGQITKEECKNCYAFRGCYLCATSADTGNENISELSKEKKLLACNNVRFTFDQMIKDACTLKELGFNSDMFRIVKSY